MRKWTPFSFCQKVNKAWQRAPTVSNCIPFRQTSFAIHLQRFSISVCQVWRTGWIFQTMNIISPKSSVDRSNVSLKRPVTTTSSTLLKFGQAKLCYFLEYACFVNKMYLVFTMPLSVCVLRIYSKRIVDFERPQGFNFIICLLVLNFSFLARNDSLVPRIRGIRNIVELSIRYLLSQ